MLLIADHLTGRRRRDGSHPLITYYDLVTTERTELSATSFANWVDKTANLLVDELGLGAGDRLALPLVARRPVHWVSLVWVMATWQAGVCATLVPEGADAVVAGPEGLESDVRPLVACSLHPLGLGFANEVPPDVLDYGLEVRAQPDTWLGAPADAANLAWDDGERILRQSDLVADLPEQARRRLIRPSAESAWQNVHDALVLPVLTGGSSVVVVGEADQARITKLADDERVDDPGL